LILIIGHYGNKNLGDEGMLTVILHFLGRNKVTVLGLNPRNISAMHGVNAHSLLSPKALAAVLKADLIVFGGGSILKNRSLLKIWPYMLMAKVLRKKVAFFGVDVAPLAAPFRKLVKICLEDSALIYVRNRFSRMLLRKYGVERPILTCKDIAFCLPGILGVGLKGADEDPAPKASRTSDFTDKPIVVGLNLRPPLFADPFNLGALEEEARKVILNLASKMKVVIHPIVMQPCDEAVINAFLNGLRNSNIIVNPEKHNYDLKTALELYKKCDLIIGMRYHSLVFAKALNIPFIPLSYAWKTAMFLREGGDGSDPEIALKILKGLADSIRR